jgi:Nucleotidyl transferase AbiEii toxin, Type IV TA system
MNETFLHLPEADQLEVLQLAAERLGRRAAMLEKDVWVIWTLEQLFKLEGRSTGIPGLRDARVPTMAFKGGTSLSKAFKVIRRFSEDVDIAFDQTAFNTQIPVFAEDISGNQISKHNQREQALVNTVLEHVIAPGLRGYAENASSLGPVMIESEMTDRGEVELFVKYPSLASDAALRERVKLEIGGRNATDPTHEHSLSVDLAEVVPELTYPTATIRVLDAERTFWEKVTLIHRECQRERPELNSVQRLSRHWSDLAELSQHEIGARALARRDLLETVVAHKDRFYPDKKARLSDCLTGNARLIPGETTLELLHQDYEAMRGMFYEEPTPFEVILERLRELEVRVNLESNTNP